MNREELLDLAQAVRAEAEAMYEEGNHGPIWTPDLGGACGDVSLAFIVLAGLPEERYRAGEYRARPDSQWGGEGHCWVQMSDGEIWDLTATQFDIPEKVYIPKAKEHYRADNGGHDAIRELDGWGKKEWRETLIERVSYMRAARRMAA